MDQPATRACALKNQTLEFDLTVGPKIEFHFYFIGYLYTSNYAQTMTHKL